MKYANAHYAKALFEAARGKMASEKRAIARMFLNIIRKNRDWPRLDRILREIEKQELEESRTVKIEIESVFPLTEEVRTEILARLGKNVRLEERLNTKLLAGIKILVNNELLIDASAKRQLERIFSHVR